MSKSDIFFDSYRYNPDYHRFADYLGVDRDSKNDIKVAKKLALLYDWASIDSGSDDMESIVARIERLRKSEGVTFTGKELTNFLYQRVRLDMDKVREAAREHEGRIKTEEARREFDQERKSGKEWISQQKEITRGIVEKSKVSQKDLDNYFKQAKKEIPKFENKMPAKIMPDDRPKAEYV